LHFINGDYKAAEAELDKGFPVLGRHKRFDINLKMFRAEIYIKQGLTKEAKKFLQYVADNGNKVYDVTRAKELLQELQ